MDFRLSEDQTALRDAARDLLTGESPLTLARERLSAADARFDELWRHVADAGWTAIMVPESAGGLGLGVAELALVLEEAGRAVAPVPLWQTAGLTVALLLGAGAEDAAYESVLAGERWTAARPLGWATVDDGRISAELELVVDAQVCNRLAVVAGNQLWSVPLADATVTAHRSLDPTRVLCDVTLSGTPGERLGSIEPGALARAREVGLVTLAASTLGTMRRLIEDTVAYVKMRKQFGVPVGVFQAVQHKLADVLVALERASASTYRAAMCLDARTADASRISAIACVATAEAARRAAKEAAQLHGGIGYTWEHDLHLSIRRVYGDVAMLDADERLRELAA